MCVGFRSITSCLRRASAIVCVRTPSCRRSAAAFLARRFAYWQRRGTTCQSDAHHALVEVIQEYRSDDAAALMKTHILDLLADLNLERVEKEQKRLSDILRSNLLYFKHNLIDPRFTPVGLYSRICLPKAVSPYVGHALEHGAKRRIRSSTKAPDNRNRSISKMDARIRFRILR